MKPGALLLLLAAAASQMDLGYTKTITVFEGPGGEANISSCPITLYGRTNNMMDVKFNADSSVSICFKNDQSGGAQDCILLGSGGGSNEVRVTTRQNRIPLGSYIHKALPNIMYSSDCYVVVELYVNGSRSSVAAAAFLNFGPQAVTELEVSEHRDFPANITMTLNIGNSTVDTWSFTKAQASKIFDLSGCRVSGVPFQLGSDIGMGPEPCSKLICDVYANITTVGLCGPTEVCLNNTCVPIVVCSVSGSTVIDFHGRVQSVKDRCVYRMMSPDDAGYEVKAGFRERRRTDVSFLDYLTISHNSGDVHLEQGGRVRIGDTDLMLNATAQLFGGVELSKDHHGVTAKMPFSNMKVFFDGNNAHVSGPAESLFGLCGDPMKPNRPKETQKAEKDSDSVAGCETQHTDAFDPLIDCNRSTEHCNLMREEPFAACHKYVDPEPYITACTNTMCKYLPWDGVRCMPMEAYVKACNLKSGFRVKNWETKAGCFPDPHAFCRDHYCSHHEFCGENRCRCRALFAAKYKPTNSLGEPAVCMQNSATMTLAGCLMADKGIEYSYLHLNDPSCKGDMNYKTNMLTFRYDSNNPCGMEVETNNSQIIFRNTIVTRNRSLDIITRYDQVEIDFSCIYRKPDVRSVSFTIQDSSVVKKIVSGIWNYTLMMNAYSDPALQMLVGPSTKLNLNQKIWLELKTEGLDDNLVTIVTDSCWATSRPSPNDRLRYDLIINRCPNPADKTVQMKGNGVGMSNVISFNMFQFSGSVGKIYLHCKMEMCPIQSQSCAPTCGGPNRRRRRSYGSNYGGAEPALITMAWSN